MLLYFKDLGSSRSRFPGLGGHFRWPLAIWRLHQSCGGSVEALRSGCVAAMG